METLIRKVLLLLTLFCGIGFYHSFVLAQGSDIIQQLVENGPVDTSGGGLNLKLFCKGSDAPCGNFTYSNIVMDPGNDAKKLQFTANLAIVLGSEILTAKNCSFIARSLIDALTPLDPNSGNIPYAMATSACAVDPGGTGRFSGATEIEYRGLAEFNGNNYVRSRGGGIVISNGN